MKKEEIEAKKVNLSMINSLEITMKEVVRKYVSKKKKNKNINHSMFAHVATPPTLFKKNPIFRNG